jgi:DNA-binding MarR family transcriptional regulator
MTRQQKIQQLFEGFMYLQKTMGTRKHEFLKKFGLTIPQMHILYSLDQNKMLTVKDVSQKMGITSSAATQIIEGLVNAGYIERKADEADRRVVHIQFSSSGEKKFAEFRQAHLQHISRIFSGLSDQELDLLIELPKKILQQSNQPE